MTTSDHDRRELFQTLEATLGRNAADIMMDHLPPHGWNNLATRDDLELFAEKLRHEFSQAMNRQTWRLVMAMLASQGIASAVIGLLA